MPKKCNKEGCNNNVFGGGLCKNHQYLRPKVEKIKKDITPYLKLDSALAKSLFHEQADQVELDAWFDNIINTVVKPNPYCWECGAKIHEKFYRHAVAHILAKAIFPSVKTHKYNYLILSAGCGCHTKAEDVDNLKQMKVCKEAARRFLLMQPDIKETHIKLYKRFSEEINSLPF